MHEFGDVKMKCVWHISMIFIMDSHEIHAGLKYWHGKGIRNTNFPNIVLLVRNKLNTSSFQIQPFEGIEQSWCQNQH